MENKTKEYLDCKQLKKHIYKRISLVRFAFLSFFDFVLALLRFILVYSFPLLVSLVVAIIVYYLGLSIEYEQTIGWGMAGASLSFFGITVAVLSTVRGVNKAYFRINSLSIFGTYKVFGLFDYYLTWLMAFLYTIATLVAAILKVKDVYPLSVSSILYTLIIIGSFVFVFIKNDKQKFIKYLKNNGVLKNKKRSIKMGNNVLFYYKHPKLKKACAFFWTLSNGSQYRLNNNISSYFNDKYFTKDGNAYSNIKLLKLYFEEIPNYISSDIDIIVLTELIKSLKNVLFEHLLKEKEYEIIGDLLNSMLTLGIKVLASKYFVGEIGDIKKREQHLTEKELKKYNQLYKDYLATITIHIGLFNQLFNSIVECFDIVKKTRTSDKTIKEIKDNLMPVFDKYKESIKNDIKKYNP